MSEELRQAGIDPLEDIGMILDVTPEEWAAISAESDEFDDL